MYFILAVIIQYPFFFKKNPLEVLLVGFVSLLHNTIIFLLSTSFLPSYSTRRSSSHIFYNSCPSPSISYFSKNSWFLELKNGIRNQDLSTRYIHCYWSVCTSRDSKLTQQGNICGYTNICTHPYL